MALRLAPAALRSPDAVTLVNSALYRREPVFSLVSLAFSRPTFLKSGRICPSHQAEFAGCGKFCRVENRARQLSPGPIFLRHTKSMFNQNLPFSGTGLANAHAGKTPKSIARYPERRDQDVF
jgi:hypothetical protein